METRVVAVDLAKDVFEIVWTTAVGQVEGRRRVTRPQFERFLRELPAGTEVVMEACSSAHLAQVRRLQAKRLEVVRDDLVQHAGLRDPRLVLVGGQRHNHPSRIGGAKPDGS